MIKSNDAQPPSKITSLAGKFLKKILKTRITQGKLILRLPSGEKIEVSGNHSGVHALVQVNKLRAFARIWRNGSLGLAEGFMEKDWETDSLATLLTFFADNLNTFEGLAKGGLLQRVKNAWTQKTNRNSRSGSKKNIAYHYDLGNDFYSLWLDESMTYSSGIFRETNDLAKAQTKKYERLCEVASLEKTHRVLEIGCGWGGLLEHLSKNGFQAEGISVSEEQVNFTSRRLKNKDKVSVRFQDYRDVEGQYDRIFSVEMFEAVGSQYWDLFAKRISDLLAHDGVAVMQMITIDENIFKSYEKRTDFIQKYIFPGGMLPTLRHIKEMFSRQGLRITDIYPFGQDYGQTLKQWQDRFTSAWPRIQAQGFDSRFFRQWMYYLCYCEVGFNSGRTDVIQIRLER